MADSKTMHGFRDELQKIAGESRLGRKPIGIERLLEREADPAHTPSQVLSTVQAATVPTTEKTAKAKLAVQAGRAGKILATMAAGGAVALGARRANEDRKVGKALRRQQNQYQQY